MKKILTLALTLGFALGTLAAPKKVVMIAGPQSHGPLSHEHRAGIMLLAKCLKEGAADLVQPTVVTNGFPTDSSVFKGADAVVIYSDGGGRHPALQGNNLELLSKLMDKGTGLLTIHYAVEPTTAKGNKEFTAWQGGCFETHWSVNPHWVANFKKLPKHPITSGVKPFQANDEWYFHMRFAKDMKGVTRHSLHILGKPHVEVPLIISLKRFHPTGDRVLGQFLEVSNPVRVHRPMRLETAALPGGEFLVALSGGGLNGVMDGEETGALVHQLAKQLKVVALQRGMAAAAIAVNYHGICAFKDAAIRGEPVGDHGGLHEISSAFLEAFGQQHDAGTVFVGERSVALRAGNHHHLLGRSQRAQSEAQSQGEC